MRLPDEKKRTQICNVAARLFASRSFHEVRLDDVAAGAHVGKGTLYIYFKSKEDLYFSLLFDGFSQLVKRLAAQLSEGPGTALSRLEVVVDALVDFCTSHPHLSELMRRASSPPAPNSMWDQKRGELSLLIENIIRSGVARGEFEDPRPDLTAHFIPGLVRSAFIYGPTGTHRNVITRQILHLLSHGLVSSGSKGQPNA